ncbi:MAG: diguanylate cyclase [Pseudomonadota bacterium]
MIATRFLPPILLGCSYFIAAAFAVLLARYEGGVAYLWIATAVLAADLMSRPRRHWVPSIIACAIASTLVTSMWGLGLAMAIPFTIINITEAVLAAWLFRSMADPRRPLGSLGWLMHFVMSVGIVAPLVAGLMAAVVRTHIAGIPFGPTFLTFAEGHALGNLTFTPIALLLTRANRRSLMRELKRRDVAETVALLMLAIVTSAYVFGQHALPLLFLPILPMILIAFRVGRGGVAMSIAMLAIVGGLATGTGEGPIQLVEGSFAARMQFFQFYLAATVLTLLPVTADLANRARLHRKMRESEAGYRMIAEYSSDVIFSLKLDGTIRYVSPSCLQLGYQPEQLVGRNCAMLIAPEHLGEASILHRRSLDMGGETNRFEYLAVTATGEKRWAETHARLILDDDGQPDGILSIVRDIHDQKLVELKLCEAALVDSLTGLGNRRAYREAVDRRIPADGDVGACVAMLDIDHFKQVNDRYGHDAGDIVLQGFANVALRVVRDGDIVARLGGEEFAVFFPGTTLPQALAICDRLRSELGSTVFRAGHNVIAVTVSGGVAELGGDGIDAALKIADMALYRAKQAGRNQLALAA